MVNGWLKSLALAANISQSAPAEVKRAYFATKPALTSSGQRNPGRSEVVLDQAILGLLINRAAAFAVGH
jgi:hypothetical protein